MDTNKSSTEKTLLNGNENLSEPLNNTPLAKTADIFLSLVIPAYNEERRLPITLESLVAWLELQDYNSELLVVDDGSEDATTEVASALIGQWREQQKSDKLRNFELVRNQHRGKAYTVRTGMLRAQGNYVLFSDADLSTPIKDADKLLKWLKNGYDIAIGSREGQGARRYDEPFYRHLMGRVFNLLVRLVTRSPFQDTQCGFKAFRREAAQDVFSRLQLYGENAGRVKGAMVTGFDVEMLFLARKRGYKIREVPVEWYHVGGSKVNPVKDSLRMIRDILQVRLNDWRGLYKK